MARMNMGAQLVIALALAAAVLLRGTAVLLHGTAADDIQVGGSPGWKLPPNTNFYSSWASTNSFEVKNTLVFDFSTGAQDVAIVTKEAYDTCNIANTISTIQNGPASIKLNTTGQHYFICTFPGHCSSGQKLAVNVVADSDSDTSRALFVVESDSDSSPPPSDPDSDSHPTPSPSGNRTSPSGNRTANTAPQPSQNSASSCGVTLSVILMLFAIALFC